MRSRIAMFTATVTAAALLAAPIPADAADPEVGTATLTPLQVTGPAAQRLNLVVLGDGYTASEQEKFHADVDRHMNVLWSIEPFRSYRSYFNVYRIGIV